MVKLTFKHLTSIKKNVSDFLNFRKNPNYVKDLLAITRFYNIRATFLTGLLLVTASILDYFHYKENLIEFFYIRIICALIIIFLGVMIDKFIYHPWASFGVNSWIFLPQVLISYFIFRTGGEYSAYYNGYFFTLAAASFVLPVSIRLASIYCISTIIMYCVACLIGSYGDLNYDIFYGNIFLMLMFIFTALYFSIYNEYWRWNSYQLKVRLSESNTALAATNNSLADIKGHMIEQEKMSALGTLSAGLLHELNNPVSYSLLAIGMAESDPQIATNHDLKESLADAKEGMQRVAAIVGDLKTFAYQKPGLVTHLPFQFERALRSATRLASFELKNIDLQYDIPMDSGVKGDEPALIGVMINLLTNAALALRASGNPAPYIKIKVWQGIHPQSGEFRCFITVKDNGTGISSKNLTKIFEPFFTTREVGQGLGLGLAVSYAIIQRHGSKLTVTSQEGVWTQFAFDLPIS
jgi:two-component system, sensor histidine kinase PhcS